MAEERITEARDSVVIEFRDTLKEVTTVTVQLNAVGDTVKVSTVTDRTRASDRSQLRDKSEKIIIRVDTVYVERRDSVRVDRGQMTGDSSRASAFVSALSYLKWIFWIIVSVTVLLIVIKMFNLFKV